MFGFVSLKKYDLAIETIEDLEHDKKVLNIKLKSKDEIINKLRQDLADNEKNINAMTVSKGSLEILCDSQKKKIQAIGGKLGGYKKQANKLKKEKNEMLNLINNLLLERQKFLKQKKIPTIEELKRNFKKN